MATFPDARSAIRDPVFSRLFCWTPDRLRRPGTWKLRNAGAFELAWFYILASRRNGTLYHGSAIDLAQRIWEHKNKLTPGFTSRYGVMMLVYYEHYELLMDARAREYKVKRWRRAWKLELIEGMNPDWRDLYYSLNN